MHNIESPRTGDDAIEHELKAKSVAPRVTPADIEANISAEFYATGHDLASSDACVRIRHDDRAAEPAMRCLTFCVLVLRNGFTVTGESACASPENFDAEIGRKVARQNAIQKVWPLMGYQLREELSKR